MGNEGSKMTFLRLAYYRDSDQNIRVFEASLVWGFTEGRTAGKQNERDRVRYPSFQKRDAHALRFGSMNPIPKSSGSDQNGRVLEVWGIAGGRTAGKQMERDRVRERERM